jgi:hypothetical protein
MCRFKERYHPTIAAAENERINAIYRRNYQLFLEDLAAGEFNALSLDMPLHLLKRSTASPSDPQEERLSSALEEGEGDQFDFTFFIIIYKKLTAEEGEDLGDENLDRFQRDIGGSSRLPIVVDENSRQKLEKNPVDTCLRTAQPWTTRQQLRSWPVGLVLKTLHPQVSRQHILDVCVCDSSVVGLK